MPKQTNIEKGLRLQLKSQEEKLEKYRLVVEKTKKALNEYLASPEYLKATGRKLPPPVDPHQYCGKICYVSEHAARQAMKTINRDIISSGREERLHKRSYYCDQCDAWHLTSIEIYSPTIKTAEPLTGP